MLPVPHQINGAGEDRPRPVALPTARDQRSNRLTEVTFVTNFLPWPLDHGGAIATGGFIQALAVSASVSVLVLTPVDYDEALIKEAEIYYRKTCRSFVCHRISQLSGRTSLLVKAWDYLRGYPRHGFWSEESEKILREHMVSTGCEVLWCNGTFAAKYLPEAKRLNRCAVLTTHNIESDLVRQEFTARSGKARWKGWMRWMDMRRLERFGTRWADVVTGITDTDVQYYRELKGSGQTFLLGVGYPSGGTEIKGSRESEEKSAICFVGSMDWLPNVRAAHYLVREIMPLVWNLNPQIKCFIVGRKPGPEVQALGSDRVIVTGEVPSVREYYERAALVVVPVPDGGGVKIKLVEAMALGKAVVSTSAGAAGLSVEHDRHLMIADRAQEFADAIVRLLDDEPKRRELGGCAREFVAANLSPRETERQAGLILSRLMQLSANRA
jgi:polysaccharide biosynthesis protein PslH